MATTLGIKAPNNRTLRTGLSYYRSPLGMISVVSDNLNLLEVAHTISVVIPVFGGEHSLHAVVFEIEPLTQPTKTKLGHTFIVTEVVLIHDCGPDNSNEIIRLLSSKFPWVQAVWLSRNYGQHAATLAGMASCTGDWVVTMDEDGQQNPRDIAKMLDMAVMDNLQIVYANPENKPPHGFLPSL